jgi:ribosomal protein L34E
MVETGKRTMKKKSVKKPSKTGKEYFRGKDSKKKCAITGKVLSGMTHEKTKRSKKSKTQKRPSVPFGGILGSKAREQVFIETGKVVAGIKKIDEVEQKYRKYVEQAIRRIE